MNLTEPPVVNGTRYNPDEAWRSKVAVADWKAAHAHVRGRSHRIAGVGCQDKTNSVCQGGVAVVSLADGAGTARFSQQGADVVTRRICQLIQRRFDDIITTDSRRLIIDDLKEHLEAKGREMDADLVELASTLLFVAVKDGVYLAGHLGDGVIGVLRHDRVEVLSPPKRGEFANTTYFVTQADSDLRLRLYAGRTDEADGFVLMSDGAAESLFDRARKVMAPAVGRILGWLDEHSPLAVTRALYYNLNSIIIEKTNDDCSIAVLKLVRKTIDELRDMDRRSLNDFLGVGENVAAGDWVKILAAFAEGCSRVEDISRRIGLPADSVRRALLTMQQNHVLDRLTAV